jgi:hypothetical protein
LHTPWHILLPSALGLTTSYGHNQTTTTTTASTPTISFPVIGISIGVPVPTSPASGYSGPAQQLSTNSIGSGMLALFCFLVLLGFGLLSKFFIVSPVHDTPQIIRPLLVCFAFPAICLSASAKPFLYLLLSLLGA